ncbi:MAG TPA: FAD-dependent oxidoreductase, partial [Pseudonocardiaceae bacterium]|nr:FAD-dependent oxidoreductase [Pseudonocardiaceae bacterium]
MSPESDRRLAVVGAGPAGLYAVQAAVALPGITGVDVFDALPAPYGLVRYGVAADHAKTKNVVRVFQKLFAQADVRFFGNVTIGTDLHRSDLLAHYDAVIYATGARHDRALAIPGADLPGSHGAAEMVSWYSGHPDAGGPPPFGTGTAAAVIGAGNVALDVVRILAKDAENLVDTDMPDDVLDVLRTSTVTDIHLIARRGPAQAKFTPVELRELGDLVDADVIIDPVDLELDPESRQEAEATTRVSKNVAIMNGWVGRPPAGRPRRIHLHFWTSPVRLLGDDHVAGIVLRRQRPGTEPVTETLDVQLVLRAIGYQAKP